jgi:hypothetical protein
MDGFARLSDLGARLFEDFLWQRLAGAIADFRTGAANPQDSFQQG